MPKVTYTAHVENITGKLGGSNFKRVKAGSIMRRGQHSRQPQTPKQQQTRGLYNTFAGQWYALPPTTKDMWNKFASLLPKPLTGFNAYLQHNVRLIKAGHADLTEITSPPSSPSTPEHIVGHELLRIDPTTMRYQWTGPDDTSNWVQLYWAVAAGYDATGKQKWQHVDTTRSDDGYIEWTNDYPLETPIHVRARTIDLFGRVSPWTDVLRWEHGQPAPIGTGCVLYLPFDEGAGTKAIDHSGQANHGDIIGASWVTGKSKYALSFDGLDDYVNLPDHPSLNITDRITVEAWINPTTKDDFEIILGKFSGIQGYYSMFDPLPDQGIYFIVKIGNTSRTSRTDAPIQTGIWTHLIGTYDGQRVRIYRNAVEQTSGTDIVGAIDTTPNPLHLAASPVPDAYYHGSTDDVRIYNQALTTNQIYDHYAHLQ